MLWLQCKLQDMGINTPDNEEVKTLLELMPIRYV